MMRSLFIIAFATLFFASGMQSQAHTAAETNEIVRLMLGAAMQIPDYLPEGRHLRRKVNFADPNVFFSETIFGRGWTSDGLRAAFDHFLEHMHEGDYSVGSGTSPHWPAAAVCQCENMHYTNAIPAIRRLASNPTYRWNYRMGATGAAIELSGVNDETTEFVDSIMTNMDVYIRRERSRASEAYCKQILAFDATNGTQVLSRNHAIAMLFRNRMIDWENAFELDGFFCQCVEGYSMSSNRFVMATNALSAVDCWQATRDRFISVTNQLLSSGQPLPWIEVGSGGN